jgi:hypothetical protein
VLHLKLLRWRARKAGRGSVVCFYDEINAFPSMSWPSVHKATCLTACDDDAALLVQRYEQALGIINDADGHSLLYRTQRGDRQGDGPASQRYILAQDPSLRRWTQLTTGHNERHRLERYDAWSEEWMCEVHTLYVDDMARMGTCKDYREAYRKFCGWKDSLLMYTSPHGLHQSDAKLQILIDIFLTRLTPELDCMPN